MTVQAMTPGQEMMAGTYDALKNAAIIATTTDAQSEAVTHYCERYDRLAVTAHDITDAQFHAEYKWLMETAVLINRAVRADEVTIMVWGGGVQ